MPGSIAPRIASIVRGQEERATAIAAYESTRDIASPTSEETPDIRDWTCLSWFARRWMSAVAFS